MSKAQGLNVPRVLNSFLSTSVVHTSQGPCPILSSQPAAQSLCTHNTSPYLPILEHSGHSERENVL